MKPVLYVSQFDVQDQLVLACLSKRKPMTKMQLLQFLPPASIHSLVNSRTLVVACSTHGVLDYYKVRDDFFDK